MNAIHFTRGAPSADAIPLNLISSANTRAIRAYGAQTLPYGSAWGFTPLREWLAAEHDYPLAGVIVGNGSISLLTDFLSANIQPGDAVLVESPTYDRVLVYLRKLGAQVISLPLAHDGVDTDALARALAQYDVKLMYLINDFNNPAGTQTSLAKRQQIAQLARQHDVLIVDDGAYQQLAFAGSALPPLRTFAPEHVITMGSFSKLLAPGLRTGWMLLPPNMAAPLAQTIEDASIAPNYFAQATVDAVVRSPAFAEQLDRLHKLYRERRDTALEALDTYLSGFGAEWTLPNGGFFIGVQLPRTEQPLHTISAAHGLVLLDGADFFAEAPPYQFVRLPFGSLPFDEIIEGVRRLRTVLETQAAARQ